MGKSNDKKQGWQDNFLQLPGTDGQKAWLNDKGRLTSNSSIQWDHGWEAHGAGRFVDGDSEKEINKYLDKHPNYSLQSNGKAPVVGYKQVDLQRGWDMRMGWARGSEIVGPTSTYIPIYGQAPRPLKLEKEEPRRESSGGGSSSSSSGSGSGSTGSTPASNASSNIRRNGVFDVPARPAGAFADDFFSPGGSTPAAVPTGNDGINANAPIFSANRLSGLSDGYPRNVPEVPRSNWADALSAAQSSNQGAFAGDTDDDANQRFAASARFRDSLYQTALS